MSAALTQRLLQQFGGDVALQGEGEAAVPVVTPRSEQALLEVLAQVRAHGARLHEDVLISRRKLAGIGGIDDKSGVVQVGPGVTLERLEQELRLRDLSLGPLSPGARGLDVAAYLEGPHAGLRAMPGGRLETACLALGVVMPDGLRFVSRPSPRSAAGPDLDALFLGGNGRFGLITSATLRLFTRPRTGRELSWTFPTAEALWSSLRSTVALGVWYERVTLAPRAGRFVLWGKVLGSAEGVERDLSSAGHAFSSVAARPHGLPPPPPPQGEEREVTWQDAARAVSEGGTVTLWRVSLDTVIAQGAGGRGLPLSLSGAGAHTWSDVSDAALRAALAEADPAGVYGGAP